MSFEGTVINGAIVLDAGHSLPEGARVRVDCTESGIPPAATSPAEQGRRRGFTSVEVMAMFARPLHVLDDEECQRILEDELQRKYGL